MAAEASRTKRILVRTGRNAKQPRKRPLQMEGAGPDMRGDSAKRERLVGVCGDEIRRFPNMIYGGRTGHTGAGTAAPALAEARDLGRISAVKEQYRLPFGPPAWTARPAVHAGRSHGIHEPAVTTRVAPENGAPP
jgi:hypothetical protein